jgi:hypothetical protein
VGKFLRKKTFLTSTGNLVHNPKMKMEFLINDFFLLVRLDVTSCN